MKTGGNTKKNGVAQLAERRSTYSVGRRSESAHRSQTQILYDMENKTTQMDLSVIEWFKGKYPGMEIKEPRLASLSATEEMRKLKVGDVVVFPAAYYNCNSIRSLPSTSLFNETIEGRKWTTRVDRNNKGVAVLRVE